jgi:chromosome segregation ATPase
MADGNELERLEGFVAKVLAEYNILREEKERLVDELQQREDKIASLESELASAQMERSDVGNRVKGLIKQIEEWESTLDESESSQSQGTAHEARMQRNLFSIGKEADTPSE